MNKEKTRPAKVRNLAKSQRTLTTKPGRKSSKAEKPIKPKVVVAGKSKTSNLSAAKSAVILEPGVYLGSD
jgi:hypothetical protein